MRIIKKKSALFDVKLYSLSDTDDPTKKEVEFILHDFNPNHNGSIIKEETATKAFSTLANKPIVARYNPVTEPGAKDDALGSHEAQLGNDRDTGEYIMELHTTPIGVFTEPAYVTTIFDENGQEKKVVAGKGILWSTRFSNVIGLLQEWIDNDVAIVSSMEILYDEYLFKDGVEEILNFVYEGHCVLNSEDRGDYSKVYPAYDVSKLTRLVAEAINKDEEKESEPILNKFKKVYELSHSDVRALIYKALDEQLESNQDSWLRDVYDNKFIVDIDTYTETDYSFETFKYEYSKSADDKVAINFESKVPVMKKTEWVELEEVKQLQAEIQRLESEKATVETEKEDAQEQFNKATETITSLNQQVDTLKDYKEKFEAEQFAKDLTEKQETYSAKFEALGAVEKYQSEEVQTLVEKSVTDKEATYQLNSMIVELVEKKAETPQEPEKQVFSQEGQKRESLIPTPEDFDSRYK